MASPAFIYFTTLGGNTHTFPYDPETPISVYNEKLSAAEGSPHQAVVVAGSCLAVDADRGFTQFGKPLSEFAKLWAMPVRDRQV